MSYEPRLVIKKADMNNHQQLFEDIAYGTKKYKKEEEQKAMEFIANVYLKETSYNIFGTECFFCQPELTSFNAKVRQKLNLLDIEYVYIN